MVFYKSFLLAFLMGCVACSSAGQTAQATSAADSSFYGRAARAGCERIQMCEPTEFSSKFPNVDACVSEIESKATGAGINYQAKCSETEQAECIAGFGMLDCSALIAGAVTTPVICGGC